MVFLKALYFALGCLFFTVGFVGVFVPLLPTTIFMILALWMFSKSSQRLHDGLFYHKLFGPPLQQWVQYRVIPPAAKILSVSMILSSFIYISIFMGLPVWLYIVTGLSMLAVCCYILSKPSHISKKNSVEV